MADRIRVLAVVGATASGKSRVALELCRRLSGELVSCDSMQVYRRMDIGTAKPSREEMQEIPHHMIDIAELDENFCCADYVERASKAIADIHARGKLPVICGGTGLYLDSLLRGGMEETAASPELRRALLEYADQYGNHALHERLAKVDPESAAAIHENNVKRVARALEIYETTGMTKTESDRRSRMAESPYDATVIGLRYPARELLYARIDRRVDEMLASGLLDEARALCAEGVFEKNSTAAQAIGYKELFGALDRVESLSEATDRLKQATRRYAKRQLTWFSAKTYVKWVDAATDSEERALADIVGDIINLL